MTLYLTPGAGVRQPAMQMSTAQSILALDRCRARKLKNRCCSRPSSSEQGHRGDEQEAQRCGSDVKSLHDIHGRSPRPMGTIRPDYGVVCKNFDEGRPSGGGVATPGQPSPKEPRRNISVIVTGPCEPPHWSVARHGPALQPLAPSGGTVLFANKNAAQRPSRDPVPMPRRTAAGRPWRDRRHSGCWRSTFFNLCTRGINYRDRERSSLGSRPAPWPDRRYGQRILVKLRNPQHRSA
jgi:hypothetical protein